jgi:hypothetical protein
MNAHDRFEIISNFIGFGSSNPNCIFLEYEPCGSWSPAALKNRYALGETYEERIDTIMRSMHPEIIPIHTNSDGKKPIWLPLDTLTTEMEVYFAQMINEDSFPNTTAEESRRDEFPHTSARWYLFPLPCLSIDEWCREYPELFGVSSSKESYEQAILQHRLKLLSRELKKFRSDKKFMPTLIVGETFYRNHSRWEQIEKILFPDDSFKSVFGSRKAVEWTAYEREVGDILFVDTPVDNSYKNNADYIEFIDSANFMLQDFDNEIVG